MGGFITSLAELDAPRDSYRLSGYLWRVSAGNPLDPKTDIERLTQDAKIEPFVTFQLPDGLIYTAASFEAVVVKAYDLAACPFERQVLTRAIAARRSSGLDARFCLLEQVSPVTFATLIFALALSVRSWRRTEPSRTFRRNGNTPACRRAAAARSGTVRANARRPRCGRASRCRGAAAGRWRGR